MFGHRDSPEYILPDIERTIEEHYEKYGVTGFYVGSRGAFDRLAAIAARNVKQRHPDIQLYQLLAYHPAERPVILPHGFENSFYPPLENTPRQYAIVRANQYMVDTADTVICYVDHIGNTRQLLCRARQRQSKEHFPIDNIAENKKLNGAVSK